MTGLMVGRMLVRSTLQETAGTGKWLIQSASLLLLQTLVCVEESTDNKTCEIPAQISCNSGIIWEEEQPLSWVGTLIKVQNKELRGILLISLNDVKIVSMFNLKELPSLSVQLLSETALGQSGVFQTCRQVTC